MGFPLSPSDEELLNRCLNRIVEGGSGHVDCIPDVEVFKFEPWDLPGLSELKLPLTKKNKNNHPHLCYFFAKFNPEMTYYPTVQGYWNLKSWKKRCRWRNDSSTTGWKTILMFYNGEHPYGEMTNWEMHVYCLDDNTNSRLQTQIGLCKIFHSGHQIPIFQKPSPDGAKEGDDPGDFTLQKQQALLNSTTHLGETSIINLGNPDKEETTVLDQQKTNPVGAKEGDDPGDFTLQKQSNPEATKERSPEVAIADLVDVTLQNHPKNQALLNSATHLAETSIINLGNPDKEETTVLDQQALANRDILRIELLLCVKDFHKEMIILMWMALDYLDEPMEENGANFFEKLVCEEYILPSSTRHSWYQLNAEKAKAELDYAGNKQSYLVFDNRSQKDHASTKTMHVSCTKVAIGENVFEELNRFKSLRTLQFLPYCGQYLYLPTDFFVRHKSLAILDLRGAGIQMLPCSIGELVQLRYLDLSGAGIRYLPKTIGLLVELQTLILGSCVKLVKFPTEINKLVKLRHLYLDSILDLDTYPEGIGALVNLQTLVGFSVGKKEGNRISELKDMNNLTGSFRIYKLEYVRTAEEAKEASLMAKTNLKMLGFRWTDDYRLPNSDDDEAILENLKPYSGLEEIFVICYKGITLPRWIANISVFDKLVSISMFACWKVSTLPSNLEKLPLLESVELNGFRGVTEMNYRGEGGHVAFPKLQRLNISGMLNLESWTKPQKGDYPSLVSLFMSECPKLSEVPSLFHLPWKLSYLTLYDCTKLAIVSGKQLSPSLKELSATKCPLINESCSKDPYIVEHVPYMSFDEVTIDRCSSSEEEE